MEKERKKISLATYVVSLIIMLAIIVGLVFVIVRGDMNQETTGNEIGNVSSEENVIEDTSNKIISNIEYIKIQLEDTEADGLAHTNPVKISDKNVISKLEEIINLGTEYEPKSTAWPDISPMVTFYLENGDEYVGLTADFLERGEEGVGNYITLFNSKNEEEKTTYKIETAVGEYLTQLYNEFEKDDGKSDYIVLHNGTEIKKEVGVQYIGYGFMEFTKENKEKYNIEYYNYEKNEYKGKTKGRFEEDQFVENVSDFAISKKYDAIPRIASKVEKLPEQLNDMMDLNSVKIEAIDLDGDGKNEHIVSVQHTTFKEDYSVKENEAYSEIYLFDSNYNKIATLASWKNNFEDESEAGYLEIENVMYLDIDNDGIMEIIIQFPLYEGGGLSILKYSNNKLDGKTDLIVNPAP